MTQQRVSLSAIVNTISASGSDGWWQGRTNVPDAYHTGAYIYTQKYSRPIFHERHYIVVFTYATCFGYTTNTYMYSAKLVIYSLFRLQETTEAFRFDVICFWTSKPKWQLAIKGAIIR